MIEKKILLISVKFFNYENIIKEKLEDLGAKVDLFDERPSNTFFSKAIIRVKKSFYKTVINRYYKELIHKVKDEKYDYFLLIKGEVTPAFFLDFLRENNPNIKFIYYTYDSFTNNKNGFENLQKFDDKFTFDNADAVSYNLKFRPLFFASQYVGIPPVNSEADYDITFIGTAHTDRYVIAESINNWCENNSLKMFRFYFSPSKILFRINRLFNRGFRGFDESKISFNKLSLPEILKIYHKSKCILDINHPNQVGLTMRTFETLGAKRKLITTNDAIRSYPFYNSCNIFIIDRKKPLIDPAFFEMDFEPISAEIYQSMSLDGWIREVFGQKETEIWAGVYLK